MVLINIFPMDAAWCTVADRAVCPPAPVLTKLFCFNKPNFLQAYVDVPAKDETSPPSKGGADRAVMDRLAITVTPKMFGQRVQLVKELQQLSEVSSMTLPRVHASLKCLSGQLCVCSAATS